MRDEAGRVQTVEEARTGQENRTWRSFLESHLLFYPRALLTYHYLCSCYIIRLSEHGLNIPLYNDKATLFYAACAVVPAHAFGMNATLLAKGGTTRRMPRHAALTTV